jgi:sortase (surface protein transpeptidase)
MVAEILVGGFLLHGMKVDSAKMEVVRPFFDVVESDLQEKVLEEQRLEDYVDALIEADKQAVEEQTQQETETIESTTESSQDIKAEPEKKDDTITDNSDKGIEIPESVKYADIDLGYDSGKYGTIQIATIGINTDIKLGATQSSVDSNDICISRQAGYCGSGMPVIIMGHNFNSMSSLPNIKKGAKIIITTNYGVYVYQVTRTCTGTINSDETNILDSKGNALIQREGKSEILQLYTCYGEKGGRFVVKAKLLKGTKIVDGD